MAGSFCLSMFASLGAETNSAPLSAQSAAQPAATAGTASANGSLSAAKLPYGVEDVLKLSRANISDDITVNYIQSSGTIYNLTAQDIVFLRNQGVSDRVINAMVDQRKVVEATAQTQQQASPAIPNAPTVPDAYVAPAAPAYIQPPATPATSSVYVIPYPQASTAYYASYGYYAPYGYPYYGGYSGPSIAIGFGFGGHGYFGHHYFGHHYGHFGRGRHH